MFNIPLMDNLKTKCNNLFFVNLASGFGDVYDLWTSDGQPTDLVAKVLRAATPIDAPLEHHSPFEWGITDEYRRVLMVIMFHKISSTFLDFLSFFFYFM